MNFVCFWHIFSHFLWFFTISEKQILTAYFELASTFNPYLPRMYRFLR